MADQFERPQRAVTNRRFTYRDLCRCRWRGRMVVGFRSMDDDAQPFVSREKSLAFVLKRSSPVVAAHWED